jgi:hypothetical protein
MLLYYVTVQWKGAMMWYLWRLLVVVETLASTLMMLLAVSNCMTARSIVFYATWSAALLFFAASMPLSFSQLVPPPHSPPPLTDEENPTESTLTPPPTPTDSTPLCKRKMILMSESQQRDLELDGSRIWIRLGFIIFRFIHLMYLIISASSGQPNDLSCPTHTGCSTVLNYTLPIVLSFNITVAIIIIAASCAALCHPIEQPNPIE